MDWALQIKTFTVALTASILATVASLAIGVLLLGAEVPGWLEVAAVLTSFGSTFLFVFERRQCYVWGVVTTLLYAMLFLNYQLLGSSIIQLYLMGALVYGYFRWGRDSDTRPVTKVRPLRWWGMYAIVTLSTWSGAVLISESLGNPVPLWDSAILALSILAQWLLDNKKVETWFVWVVINVIAVPLYWSQGLSLVAVQYVVFLINAFYGWYVWTKSMQRSQFEYGVKLFLKDTEDMFETGDPDPDFPGETYYGKNIR